MFYTRPQRKLSWAVTLLYSVPISCVFARKEASRYAAVWHKRHQSLIMNSLKIGASAFPLSRMRRRSRRTSSSQGDDGGRWLICSRQPLTRGGVPTLSLYSQEKLSRSERMDDPTRTEEQQKVGDQREDVLVVQNKTRVFGSGTESGRVKIETKINPWEQEIRHPTE